MLDFQSLLPQLCARLVSEVVGAVSWAGFPPWERWWFLVVPREGGYRGDLMVAAPQLAAQRKQIHLS